MTYYADDLVTLYHGNSLEVTAWLDADVLVTDPPYGRAWKQGRLKAARLADDSHAGIANDLDTTVRDSALALWGDRLAIAFGDLMLPAPTGCRQVLIYRKQPNAGTRGAMGGWRRDAEGGLPARPVADRPRWTVQHRRDRITFGGQSIFGPESLRPPTREARGHNGEPDRSHGRHCRGPLCRQWLNPRRREATRPPRYRGRTRRTLLRDRRQAALPGRPRPRRRHRESAMSYLTDRLHADLDAHQALPEPPEHVLIATDDLTALLRELGTVQAQMFDAEGLVRLWAAMVRHVDDESQRYRLAWQSARRGRRVARRGAAG